ncbi:guanylate kinase [Terrimesophilobacter mesophilus]|uniref:Guanylate kinase n=1 Tax=Terrimesophilobacter mesophilus TaxID=433647 RepID=A0A4R8V6T0_9MICO|nr:guanylate kinase [Terrimesophilobacter mesophilus]TFB78794.1 guanylate kinase [Terrimesophilobacter mesophilus]
MPRVNPPDVDRAAASRAAVAARRARADIKRAIAENRRRPLDVLNRGWADPHSAEAGLRVRELVASIRGLGPTRSSRILSQLGIAESKRIGGLGVRQRETLRDWLSRRDGGHAADRTSKLVVLAGPTAVGKGAVSTYIREHHPDVLLSVSATTRSPRPGEIDGVNYYFVSDEEFDRLESSGAMLETATVHNAYRYGTPRAPIDAALAQGKSVLLEIDLQGARAVRRAMPEAILIFLLPPSWEELVRRLVGRGTEDAAEQARRLDTAKTELAAADEFDYRVVNTEVSRAAQEVVDLMSISADDNKES